MDEKPTNEHIVKMLDEIRRELSELRASQQELVADLHKLAKTIE